MGPLGAIFLIVKSLSLRVKEGRREEETTVQKRGDLIKCVLKLRHQDESYYHAILPLYVIYCMSTRCSSIRLHDCTTLVLGPTASLRLKGPSRLKFQNALTLGPRQRRSTVKSPEVRLDLALAHVTLWM